MLKAFKYRLYPSEDQRVLINKHLGSSRFIYNLALETKMNAYNSNKVNLSRFDLSGQLVELKKEATWLKEINSQTIQYSLLCLDNAYKKFFKGAGFPKFKRKTGRQSFHIPQSVQIIDNQLYIPKFNEGIEIRVDRRHRGSIRSATISRTPTNKYFVSVLCETGELIPEKGPYDPQTTVGIDLGLKDLIILSSGEKIPKIRELRTNQIAHLQRILAKRKKGSSRRKRLQMRINKLFERTSNKRNDLIHKTSNEITNRFDTIVIEDLNVRGMMKNHKLARSIGEASWSEFTRMLEYKCLWKGKTLVRANRFFASSKTCSSCGSKYKELKLSEREWTCGFCGTKHDRDLNAAINLKNWPVEHRFQDVENSSVDERSKDPKKHLVCETLKKKGSLEILETTTL